MKLPEPKQIQKRLTDEQVLQIIALVAEGSMSLRSIAKRFNATHQTVIGIRDGTRYKHVPRSGGPTESLTHDVHLERVAD